MSEINNTELSYEDLSITYKLIANGDYKEALTSIERLSQKFPDNYILYDIGGQCYYSLKQYELAIECYDESIKINPDNAYVLNYLAYSWLERDYKIDSALQMLEKAYVLKSNDAYIIDSIGWAYYLVNDFTKAENFLKRAVELMPNDPVVIDHYGDILWRLDRRIQARYFWESVLKLKETEEIIKKNIKSKLIEGLKNS
mgnify:CR=1 FL=1